MWIAGVGRINSRCNDLMLAVHVKWIAGERRSCVCRAAVVGRAGPSVVLHGQLLCKQKDTCQFAKPSSRIALWLSRACHGKSSCVYRQKIEKEKVPFLPHPCGWAGLRFLPGALWRVDIPAETVFVFGGFLSQACLGKKII
jgi:hypothetical protein